MIIALSLHSAAAQKITSSAHMQRTFFKAMLMSSGRTAV